MPNLPHKGDVIDWIAAGGTKAELARLTEAVIQPPPGAEETASSGEPPHIDDAPQDDTAAPDQDDARRQRGMPYGRLLVLGVGDITTAEPRSYLLKGLLSPGEISLWVGPPKCGKSFLLLHVAYLLSSVSRCSAGG